MKNRLTQGTQKRMELTDRDIYTALKLLMDKKSQRDKIQFTSYQLAKALNVQHSIITRLLHPDANKRVCNPRVDTVTKIVDFFNADGFRVSFDDLLNGLKQKSAIEVNSQPIGQVPIEKEIPVYTFSTTQRKKMGVVNMKITTYASNLVALISDEAIPPVFKKGSIFLIDKKMAIEEGMLVAVQLSDHKKILIRKFYKKGSQTILKSCDNKEKPIVLMPTLQYKILGVVVQVNAKL